MRLCNVKMECQFGMSDVATLLEYPTIPDITECQDIIGIYCYIINNYEPGWSILVEHGQSTAIKIGDWNGNLYDDNNAVVNKSLSSYVPLLLKIMDGIQISKAQYYFANNNKLVDVRISLNKFIGPGMLRDIFSGSIDVQDTYLIDSISSDKIDELKNIGKFVVKPSRYRYNNDMSPLYARI